MERRPVGLRGPAQRDHRIGDVVDRHDIDGSVRAARHRHVGAARERTQRPVEHVERAGPAAGPLSHDDAGAHDRHRHTPAPAPHELLGLELRVLVGVAKALADVQLVLAEAAGPVARDIRGRDIREAAQARASLAMSGELEHPLRAVQVDRPRRAQPVSERNARAAVDDLVHPRGQPLAAALAHAQTRPGEIAAHGDDALRVSMAPADRSPSVAWTRALASWSLAARTSAYTRRSPRSSNRARSSIPRNPVAPDSSTPSPDPPAEGPAAECGTRDDRGRSRCAGPAVACH